MKNRFSIGERRGMIVVLTLLAIIVATVFGVKHFTRGANFDAHNKAQLDSIASRLHQQIEAEKAAPSPRKSQKEKSKKKRKKKTTKKKNQNKKQYGERDPLNESLPRI